MSKITSSATEHWIKQANILHKSKVQQKNIQRIKLISILQHAILISIYTKQMILAEFGKTPLLKQLQNWPLQKSH